MHQANRLGQRKSKSPGRREKAMKEFIERIARSLVDRPDEVQVNVIEGEQTSVYEIRTGDGDLGKIIGKHGQTIRAIRTLLRVERAPPPVLTRLGGGPSVA
jgi:predicted RNA-binding protein YlqC (UPF0109 family)